MELSTFAIRHQLASPQPEIRRAAFEQALGLVHCRPRLALAILTGNFGYQEKRDVVNRMRTGMTYPFDRCETSVAIVSLASIVSLPPFFRLLAQQPKKETVRAVHQLWAPEPDVGCGRGPDKSAPGPIGFIGTLERHLATVSKGYAKMYEDTVPVMPRAQQMVIGYNVKLADASGQITDHNYYFVSGCRIDGLTFDYQFRPQRSLA